MGWIAIVEKCWYSRYKKGVAAPLPTPWGSPSYPLLLPEIEEHRERDAYHEKKDERIPPGGIFERYVHEIHPIKPGDET
jgi:hypothetical protein